MTDHPLFVGSDDFIGWEDWPYATSVDFGEFSLHDSGVYAVERSPGLVRLYLDFGTITPKHSANPTGKGKTLQPCVLTFNGVSLEERSAEWLYSVVDGVRVEIPEAERIDLGEDMHEIASAEEVSAGKYVLIGDIHRPLCHYLREMTIHASSWEIRWKAFTTDAWWWAGSLS